MCKSVTAVALLWCGIYYDCFYFSKEDAKMNTMPVHYRYKDAVDHTGLLLVEEKFYPVRETDCFYFILPEWQYNMYKRGNGNPESLAKRAKRVSKNGLRRKCYPSKEQAFESYLIRKKKQIWHANDALNRAKLAIEKLSAIESPDDLERSQYKNCKLIGRAPFIDEYIFD